MDSNNGIDALFFRPIPVGTPLDFEVLANFRKVMQLEDCAAAALNVNHRMNCFCHHICVVLHCSIVMSHDNSCIVTCRSQDFRIPEEFRLQFPEV